MTNEPSRPRRAILRYLGLTLIVVGIVAAAIGIVTTAISVGPLEERADMNAWSTPTEMKGRIPQIDLNAPTETKTATFALG